MSVRKYVPVYLRGLTLGHVYRTELDLIYLNTVGWGSSFDYTLTLKLSEEL